MPKRRREDEEDTLETGNVDHGDFSDGDESDEEEGTGKMDKYDVMQEDDIEGQEDPTQEFDGEVQITPFNMKEEMEEGHFDKEGTYIFGKRAKDEIKDHWLDNIDWVKVNNTQATSNENAAGNDEAMDADNPGDAEKFDSIATYKEILDIVLPGETVLKALKRLGGGKMQTASERWKKKKQGGTEALKNESNKEQIVKLTGLADSILSNTGNMDIYQETFEGIRFKIQQSEANSSAERKLDADLDMFGEVFDEGKKDTKPNDSTDEPMSKKVRFNEDVESSTNREGVGAEETNSDSVMWEFKWENEEKAEIHGPHSTNEMQDWVTQGYFDAGVWVRRVGQQSEFYSSKRVDFDLYL